MLCQTYINQFVSESSASALSVNRRFERCRSPNSRQSTIIQEHVQLLLHILPLGEHVVLGDGAHQGIRFLQERRVVRRAENGLEVIDQVVVPA